MTTHTSETVGSAENALRTRPDVSLRFGADCRLTGTLHYDPLQADLYLVTEIGVEDLSIDLRAYALTPAAGCVFVKDWSEHTGLAHELETAGCGSITQRLTGIGPFNSTAFEMKVVL